MSNELVPASQDQLSAMLAETGPSKYADEASFGVLATSGWLPYLQLMNSNSVPVQEGKIGQGTWALVKGKGDLIDLSKECDVVVLAWRPKAMSTGDGTIAVYNPASEKFKEIMLKADEQNSGCFFGPEFLIWIPKEKMFASLLMGSKTSRNQAAPVKARMGKAITLKSQLISNSKFKWWGPIITICSTEHALPDAEELRQYLTRFKNPPEQEFEATEASDEVPRDR